MTTALEFAEHIEKFPIEHRQRAGELIAEISKARTSSQQLRKLGMKREVESVDRRLMNLSAELFELAHPRILSSSHQ